MKNNRSEDVYLCLSGVSLEEVAKAIENDSLKVTLFKSEEKGQQTVIVIERK